MRRSIRSAVLLSLFAASLASTALAQIPIATYKGTITPGGHSRQIEINADGSIVSTDESSMRKFSSGWSSIHTIPAFNYGDGAFLYAHGCVQLPNGNFVVNDWGGRGYDGSYVGSAMVVINSTGAQVARWPFNHGDSYLVAPVLASNGDIYHGVVFYNSNTVMRRWSTSGQVVQTWTVPGAVRGMDIRDGIIYLPDANYGRIYRYGLDGTALPTISTARLGTVLAIAVDASKQMYLLVHFQNEYFLSLLAPNGARLGSLTNLGPTTNWTSPTDLELVNDLTLFVADGSWGYGGIHELTVNQVVPAATTTWGRVKALYR